MAGFHVTRSARATYGFLFVALVLTLSACGSSSKTQTASRQQAAALNAQLDKACQSPGTPIQRCQQAAKAAGAADITNCGRGVITNGSCVFADHLIASFRASYAGGGSSGKPTAVAVKNEDGSTTATLCDPEGSNGKTWATHGTWRCHVTEAGSKVYVIVGPHA